MNDFSNYSWTKWFESMTVSELEALAVRWTASLKRTTGHEHDVMVWDLIQLFTTIADRRTGDLQLSV